MSTYRLNLNQQSNGDYEVHENGCKYYPTQNYDELGFYSTCVTAVIAAKIKYPTRQINGCYYCSKICHTS